MFNHFSVEFEKLKQTLKPHPYLEAISKLIKGDLDTSSFAPNHQKLIAEMLETFAVFDFFKSQS